MKPKLKEPTTPVAKEKRELTKASTFSRELSMRASGTVIAPKEVLTKVTTLSPQAVDTLEELLLGATSETVRLKAALEILAIAGVSKENKITIKTETKDLEDEELTSRLEELLDRAKKSAMTADFPDAEEGEFSEFTRDELDLGPDSDIDLTHRYTPQEDLDENNEEETE